jgi:hypothetical protein
MPKHAIKVEAQGDRCLSKGNGVIRKIHRSSKSPAVYTYSYYFFFSPLSSFSFLFIIPRSSYLCAIDWSASSTLSLSERCVHAYEACTPPKSISTKRRWEYNQGRVSGIFQPVFWYLHRKHVIDVSQLGCCSSSEMCAAWKYIIQISLWRKNFGSKTK